jgi:hypothetical protein
VDHGEPQSQHDADGSAHEDAALRNPALTVSALDYLLALQL